MYTMTPKAIVIILIRVNIELLTRFDGSFLFLLTLHPFGFVDDNRQPIIEFFKCLTQPKVYGRCFTQGKADFL